MGLFRRPADHDLLSESNKSLLENNRRLLAEIDLLRGLLASRQDVAALLAVREHEVGTLKADNARLQAHFDWLAAHVNNLTMERGTLFDKVLNVTFPAVPIIAQQLPGADPNYQAAPPAPEVMGHPHPQLGDILAKAREIEAAARRGAIDQDGPLGLSFDDMGDDAAARAGLMHAPDGTVVAR